MRPPDSPGDALVLRWEQRSAGETVFVERANEVLAGLSLLCLVIVSVNPGLKKSPKGRGRAIAGTWCSSSRMVYALADTRWRLAARCSRCSSSRVKLSVTSISQPPLGTPVERAAARRTGLGGSAIKATAQELVLL